MTPLDLFAAARADCPLVAILRGIRPEEAVAIGRALVAASFRIIEVPLNSPQPLDSIAALAAQFGDDVLIGAGTVLSTDDVANIAARGARLMVSPNTNPAVISAAVAEGLVALPGFLTPSEAFAALDAGAHGLKLFPAEAANPGVLKAMRTVLPATTPVFAVGGITPDKMAPYLAAGATGFGLGGALYQPGDCADKVAANARAFQAALREAER